jgi:hypothetical protein
MYINAVADSVKLHLHDFYNTTFKIKHKFYIAPGSAAPPPPLKGKILGARLQAIIIIKSFRSLPQSLRGNSG